MTVTARAGLDCLDALERSDLTGLAHLAAVAVRRSDPAAADCPRA